MKFDSGYDRRKSFIGDGEWRGLRNEQAAYTNKDRAQQDRLSQIRSTPRWFDFTLATA